MGVLIVPHHDGCKIYIAAGPPAAKLPVAALTATVSTTVHAAAEKSSPTPKPASQLAPPIPNPTNTPAVPTPTPAPAPVPIAQPTAQSGSGPGGDSSESKIGGPRSSAFLEGSNSVSQGSESGGDSGSPGDTGPGGDTGLQSSGSGGTGNWGSSQGGGGSSDVKIGSESQGPTPESAHAAAALPAPIATIGSQIITASPGASEVYYAGTTLSQNGLHATIDNTEVYVGSSGLVIGGSSTVAIPIAPSSASSSQGESGAVTFAAAGYIFTSSPSGIAVAGTTIQSGHAAVIFGTTVSYGPSGLAIGTSTIPVPTPPPSGVLGAGPTNVFTLGGQIFTANPTAVYIAGTTLTAGGSSVTVSGTAISLGDSGIVIASSTYAIPFDILPSSTMVIGSETLTICPTAIEVGGTTLSDGGSTITVHGIPISLGPSGLVAAGSTVFYRGGPLTAASQTSEGLGGLILAGFGPSTTTASAMGTSTSTSTPGLVAFQGAAAKSTWEPIIILGLLLVGRWVV